MQTIRTLEQYDDAIQQPASLLVFSSLKSCKPCRDLKVWLETDYSLELDHIYYIDIYNKNVTEITNDIVALPTVILYKDSVKVSEVEGFMKHEIEPQLSKLQDTYANIKIECTSLLEPESPTVSVQAIPFVTIPNVPETLKNVDDILKELEDRLSNDII
jgi:hypothetical protein